MPVIETHNLTKRFRKTTAVDTISFRVEQGQVYGFLGPNGSGKTTTIGMVLGITTPSAGEISLFGESGRKALHLARQRIGGTLEQPNFYPYLSGWDNMHVVAEIKGVGKKDVNRVMETVDMTNRASKQFKTFSLGMKQRLSIAAALLGDPELLILDEPTNGLDPEGMKEIRELVLQLAGSGKTIFISSHLLNEVEKMCTNVAIIKNGKLIRQGTVDEVTKGDPTFRLKAKDAQGLLTALKNYSDTNHIREEDDLIITELKSHDPAALNRYLVEQGIYLSELSEHEKSLEEAFMELTGNTENTEAQADQ